MRAIVEHLGLPTVAETLRHKGDKAEAWVPVKLLAHPLGHRGVGYWTA